MRWEARERTASSLDGAMGEVDGSGFGIWGSATAWMIIGLFGGLEEEGG